MATNSNLEPNPSNLSAHSASESQVLGSWDSPLLPSEPPHIRNWFSSYVYESPELNPGNDFQGCNSLEENESEKDEFNFRELKRSNGLVVDEKVASNGLVRCSDSDGDNHASQVPNSSDSLLLVSEDINFFFSYLLVLSEPPDITNWFSSYAYESPTLDTSDCFRFSDDNKRREDREGSNAGNSTKGEQDVGVYRTDARDDLVGEKIASTNFNKYCSSVKDNKDGHQHESEGNYGADTNKNNSILNNLHSESILRQILGNERAENHDEGCTKHVGRSSLNDQHTTRKLEGKVPQDAIDNATGCNGGESPRKLIHRRYSAEKGSRPNDQTEDNCVSSPGVDLDLLVTNEEPFRKASRGNKENYGNQFAGNGFISARKSRSNEVNDENFFKRSLYVQSESMTNGVTVSSAGKKNAATGRKVLSETTNVQHSEALGITGKWQCPQKSKPNLGPPLKQLRLERWVHRL
ncbi:hypothetical protein RJ639_038263 [Escallonia herrerae]|uniref:Uncharacterized protein n=1 Tax=Escallonia herrerae TaxID=1293975 RepID=A0AA88WN23_9ASTE|nr:hypothetical protein RJ639_038263 [Escallonia herrerae]